MYKIMHISDTHIKNLVFHNEYRIVFSEIYKIAKEEKVDYIVHCGDLAHTKTQLSPEYFELASDFLKNLADIAPTYIILGNHDGNLRNEDRQDAVTPIVQALNHPNLNLLKNSGEVHPNKDICFNVLSIFDEDNWQEISNKEKINIALYHGAVFGVETDTGYVLEHGDHEMSVFEPFDFAMLGDIHKSNQKLDFEGRIRYCGSTVQQNFGETNDKGVLIWTIKDKNSFKVEHKIVPNPKPFVTIEIEKDGKLPKAKVPDNAQLRIVCNSHIPSKDLKKAIDVANSIWKPVSITTKNQPGKALSVQEVSGEFKAENLRDIAVQENLIKEYLKEYEISDELMQTICELNKQYSVLAEQDEEVARNINYKIKNLEFSNLFNYGEENKINFEKLRGLVGVFGKNYSGKSSSVDSLLWSLFNSISKNVRKNVDIINQNKNEASTKLEIEVGTKTYTIEREAEKYIKKLKGVETVEAKTDVEFSVYDSVTGEALSLNGVDRKETDANIRKVFGLLEDFLLTSMTSQHGAMSFINEGSTKRKEILSKFLDLDIFDKKYKLIKKDSGGLKAAIKKMEGRDFAQEIMIAERDSILTSKQIDEEKKEIKSLKKKIDQHKEQISELKIQEATGPKISLIDISHVESEIEQREQLMNRIKEKKTELENSLFEDEKILKQLIRTLSEYDWEELQKDKEKLEELNKESIRIDAVIKSHRKDIDVKKEQLKILETVPCEDKFPKCRFLIEANEQKNIIPIIEKSLTNEQEVHNKIEERLEELGESIFVLNEWEKLNKNKNQVQEQISDCKLKIQKLVNKDTTLESELIRLKEQQEEYYTNEEWMKKLRDIETEKKKVFSVLTSIEDELTEKENCTSELSTEKGILTQKIKQLEEEQKKLHDMREEYAAYELLEKAMHSNGIVYDIIKKRLPIINLEMSKILSNIVNFEVFFEDDGKKLDIYIKHPKYDPRPLELGSGAEKAIASIAIRLALIKTTSLPVGDLFIMDEPATSLDEENMEGFTKILEMVKNNFKTVIIISHLDALKDVVDKQITIKKIDGFANIEI